MLCTCSCTAGVKHCFLLAVWLHSTSASTFISFSLCHSSLPKVSFARSISTIAVFPWTWQWLATDHCTCHVSVRRCPSSSFLILSYSIYSLWFCTFEHCWEAMKSLNSFSFGSDSQHLGFCMMDGTQSKLKQWHLIPHDLHWINDSSSN